MFRLMAGLGLDLQFGVSFNLDVISSERLSKEDSVRLIMISVLIFFQLLVLSLPGILNQHQVSFMLSRLKLG